MTCVACREQMKSESEPEPLLLLEEGDSEELDFSAGPMVDNSRCHVCHINYTDEELTLVHARADIGCEDCHGASDAHCSDEDNITPPDTMFAEDKIMAFCMDCHTKEEIDVGVHKLIMDETDPKITHCTACHGEHRLNYRTRRWDKTTGELIKDDHVRMTTDEMLQQE